ncbi:MAG: site-specific integrase [Acidobacteria bacterium]|nr:site-specific integrase [Acidobacteriota bacterium]
MSLTKRGKIYHYDFFFEGERHQKSTGMQNLRDAERVESAVKADLARRKFNLPSKSVRFSEVWDRYSEVAKSNEKPSYVTEKYHIASHLKPHFGQIMVHAIGLDTCEKYKRNRLQQGAAKATIYRELAILKAILKYAGQSGFAPEGLGKYARMFPNVEYKGKRVLKLEELGRLVEVCASLEFQVTVPHLLPAVVVGAFEGLRPTELARPAKENVDLEVGIVWVGNSKTPTGIRYVPLKKEAWEVLRYWLPRTNGKWVFPSPKKPGAHIKDFGKAFEKAVNRAGLQGITPDCLRHTFATEVYRRARRRSDLREMMGHSKNRHTELYLHEE